MKAQNAGIGDPAAAPGTPASSYALSGIENVNLYNGNLDVTIPVMNITGRGSASKSVVVPIQRRWNADNTGSSYAPDGWSDEAIAPYYTAGHVEVVRATGTPNACLSQDQNGQYYYQGLGPFTTYIVWTSGLGTQSILYDMAYNGQSQGATITQCSQLSTYQYTDRGRVFRSVDGTDLTFIGDADVLDGQTGGPIAGTVITRDGLRIHFILTSNGTTQISDANSLEDRNGNLISFSLVPGAYNGGAYTVTDPVGRTETITYVGLGYTNTPNLQDVLTFPGYTGTQRQVQVNYGYLSSALASGETMTSLACLFPELGGSSGSWNDYVVTSIVLPDNSQYTMQYNAYGELEKLTLPTGGYYKYVYAEAQACTANSGSGVITLQNFSGYKIYRRLLERDEYADGVNLSGTVVYTATAYASNLDPNHSTRPGTMVEVDFKDASNNLLRVEKHFYYGDPSSTQAPPTNATQAAQWWLGLEFRTEIGNGSSTLRTVQSVFGQRPCAQGENCWFDPQAETSPPHDIQVCQTNTVLENGQTSGVVLAYDQYNNVTSKWEFDYGAAPAIGASCPSTPTSSTRYTYNTYVTSSSYTTPTVNILDLLASTAVNPNSGNYGNVSYTYDGSAANDAPGIVGHDGNYGTGYNVRGNPTTISRSSSSLGQNISTTLTYDIAGNVLSVKDQNNHTTTIQYSDPNNTYANPTQQTNAAGHITSAQYDWPSGKIISRTDPNGFATAYQYADSLDRLTLVTAAQGTSAESQTQYIYTSTTHVTQKQDQIAAGHGELRTDTLYDGLGRPKETDAYETTSQYIATTQTYDALGRVATTTNPSRPGDGLGYLTTYSYDSLGRQTTVLYPDGSSASTTYSGNQVTITDEAGKVRTTITDGLGRMTSVTEDPGSSPHLAYGTTYTYDPLNNLISVTQGPTGATQTRTFNYDNLGWLTSATQPEMGTVAYTYDGVGNLLTRTDARGFRTTYGYDAINRTTSKTYSDTTPSVSYTYDNLPNSKGYLTQISNYNSITNFTSFDPLGRVTGSNQVTGQQTYGFSYTYNLAGALTSETYPSTRVVSFSYDGANRPLGVSGLLGTTGTTYTGAITYAPHGGVMAMTLGNGLTENTCFNNRLQLTGRRIGSASITNCSNSGSDPLNLTFAYASNTNNGNPQSQTIARPSVNVTQTYGYDNVNRLQSASQTGTTSWSQTYGFDNFGNRWLSAYNGLPTPTAEVPQTPSWYLGNNRITGWSYDSAGNITSVQNMQRTFVYDAENRQISNNINGTATLYSYDGAGQRVTKYVSPNPTSVYVYDAMGLLVAEYAGPTNPDTGTRYLTADHLGSTRLVTKMDGTIDRTYDYLPFGEEIGASYPSAPSGPSQKFTSKERDAETGLDWFSSRYFSSPQGRFTSPDEPLWGQYPTDPQSWNLYSYGLDNPLRYSDPTGHDPCENGVNPDTGNICTVVTAPTPVEPVDPGQVFTGFLFDLWNVVPTVANATYALTENTPGYTGPQVRMPYWNPKNQSQQRGAIISTAAMMFAGRLPVLKGQMGVLRAIREVEAEGATVLSSEVWIDTAAGRIRADFVATDSAGNLFIGEAKNGPNATFTTNQLGNNYPAGGPVSGTIMSSSVPGLPAGTPIQNVPVRVFKY